MFAPFAFQECCCAGCSCRCKTGLPGRSSGAGIAILTTAFPVDMDSYVKRSPVILAVALISATAAVSTPLLIRKSRHQQLPSLAAKSSEISNCTTSERKCNQCWHSTICPSHLIVKFWEMETRYRLLTYLLYFVSCSRYKVYLKCHCLSICNGFCTCLKCFHQAVFKLSYIFNLVWESWFYAIIQ